MVLFGSRARGDAFEDSDYDLLIGLCREDGLRLTDRIAVFQDIETGKVQVLAYPPAELRCMMDDANGLLLNVLAEGQVLFDRGAWKSLRVEYEERVERGEIRREGAVWAVRT